MLVWFYISTSPWNCLLLVVSRKKIDLKHGNINFKRKINGIGFCKVILRNFLTLSLCSEILLEKGQSAVSSKLRYTANHIHLEFHWTTALYRGVFSLKWTEWRITHGRRNSNFNEFCRFSFRLLFMDLSYQFDLNSRWDSYHINTVPFRGIPCVISLRS